MVRIRLARIGLKRQPAYRIVVIDQRKSRNSREIENIGHHNTRTRPENNVVDEARALYWLSVGAQPSEAVRGIFERTGTWDRFQRLRKGEEMEKLVAEAEEQAAQREIDYRTKYPAPGHGEGKGPRAQARAEAAAEAQNEGAEDNE